MATVFWAGSQVQGWLEGQGRNLLEVNHVPNVTRFAELRAAYLEELERFLAGSPAP